MRRTTKRSRLLIPAGLMLTGLMMTTLVSSVGVAAPQPQDQLLVSVTVAATRPGVISLGCGPSPVVSTPAEFTLTRSGVVTDGLTVSISWSGDLALGTTISPATVAFAPGSATATVTPTFAAVPESEGRLTLTVTSDAGYRPGVPSSASTTFSTYAPPCAPPIQVPPPPPLMVSPAFTG
jgi:hypothetical protein